MLTRRLKPKSIGEFLMVWFFFCVTFSLVKITTRVFPRGSYALLAKGHRTWQEQQVGSFLEGLWNSTQIWPNETVLANLHLQSLDTWWSLIPMSFLCTFHFCLNQILPHSDCYKDFFFLVSNFSCVGSLTSRQRCNCVAEIQGVSCWGVNLGPHSSHKIRLVGCDSEKFHPQTFLSHQHV